MAKFTAEQIAKFEANLKAYTARQEAKERVAKLTAHLDREKQAQADAEAHRAQEAKKQRATNNSDSYKLATSKEIIARAKREAITCQHDSEMARAQEAMARFEEGKAKLAEYEARLAEAKAKPKAAKKHYLASDDIAPHKLCKHVTRVLQIINGKRVWAVKCAY